MVRAAVQRPNVALEVFIGLAYVQFVVLVIFKPEIEVVLAVIAVIKQVPAMR